MTLTFGSLFAGIGGFDLGLERAGMIPLWQVEIDDYCNRVLAKHWPDVTRFRDVREVHGAMAHASERRYRNTKEQVQPGGNGPVDGSYTTSSICPSCLPPVDLICGGFPCQPHSLAGKREGAEDDRDLWPEFKRIIDELRPRWVVAENVPGIRTTILDAVLSDLEGMGYAWEAAIIPACAVDAPHRRDRLWIVANANKTGFSQQRQSISATPEHAATECNGGTVAESDRSNGYRRIGDVQMGRVGQPGSIEENDNARRTQWLPEPDVGRVAHGIPNRLDRLRALGNAVVPQVVEFIGRLIVEVEAQ